MKAGIVRYLLVVVLLLSQVASPVVALAQPAGIPGTISTLSDCDDLTCG
jgi:hypothetical protein